MLHSVFGFHNILLILFTFIVTLLTSFSLFSISTRILLENKLKRKMWLVIGALTMGIGIWTMHFIGTLAFMLQIQIRFSLAYIGMSLIISVIASFLALLLVSSKTSGKSQFILGWFIFGSSILGMHYLSLKAINISFSYNPVILMILVLLSYIPSFIIFRISYIHKSETSIPLRGKLTSGFLTGIAILAMHYTEMFVAKFPWVSYNNNISLDTIDSNQLAVLIGLGTSFIIVIVLISIFIDHKFTDQSRILEMNEQYYKSLFEENSDAVLVFDLEGRFLHINQSVNELYGYTLDELHLTTFTPLLLPEYLEKAEYHFNLAKKGTTTTFEASVLNKQGYRMDLNVRNIPIVIDNEIVSVFSIVKDVTDIKRAEDALIEAESKYRSLVEQSSAGVYIYQGENLVYVNPRLAEIMGYSQDELYKLKLSDYVHEQDLDLVKENIKKRLNGSSAFTYEYRAIKKDGSVVLIELHGSTTKYHGNDAVNGTIFDITDRKKTEETIEQMAYFDTMTGLPNRNFLFKQLKEFNQDETINITSVLLMELKRFKNIDNTIGQELGNSLILEAGLRIQALLDTNGMLTRWHEDKFVILLTNMDDESTSQIARKLLEALSEPLKIAHYDLYVNPSIGIAVNPGREVNTETLLNMANSALQYAKRHGNNSFHFYTSDLTQKSHENLELEMDLYKAIDNQELTIHYQPQFHLGTGECIGNEALIRWNHPTRGMIPPSTFIPIAEETGLIIPIGEWILKEACKQNKVWQNGGLESMVISVNLSSLQFLQADLVEVVERVLEETKLEPHYLDLEITESMTMDVNQTTKTLHALKELGVKISIDDFGTGYSSLYYLKEFPIDRLKIDQSFIRDCTSDSSNATIVRTIISMAHHLNIQVIAEGVETKEHLEFLQKNLCDEVQGYLLSKPLPVEELEGKFPELQGIIKTYGITSDISERLWLERELNLARQELQDTIRQQDGMTLKYKEKDGKLIHTLCDGELIYRIGLTPEKVIGKELSEILPYETAIHKEQYYRRAWEGEQNVSYEGEGNGFFYLATLRPIFRNGKVLEVIASCVDITERKQMEEALRQSKMNYRIIAENTTDIISIEDKNGNILYTSPSSELVKGYLPIDLLGSSGFTLVYPDDLPLVESVFKEVLETKMPRLVIYRYIHKNGTIIYLETKVTPVLCGNGEVEQFVLVARDITEQKNSEEF